MINTVFNPFESEDVSAPYSDLWRAKRRIAQALRDLTEVLVTSTSTVEELDEFASDLERQAVRFAKAKRLFGMAEHIADGAHGGYAELNHELNAMGGWSNPLSPGITIWQEGAVVRGTVTCGYAYEGPPGHIHGGYVAAIFDQFVGMAQLLSKSPGLTGSLQVSYLQPTPLCVPLQLEAELLTSEGRKTRMAGRMYAGETLTASCEAVFVRPRTGMRLDGAGTLAAVGES
jgi:acyl-coenzyme A thioesterase PaaI-like protein